MEPMASIPYGYCHCGCGQKTKLATHNYPERGVIKGKPNRFCAGHGSPKMGQGSMPYIVDEATGCWVWQRAHASDDYGRLMRDGVMWKPHRWYYTQAKGPIPKGMDLDHLCRNRRCVNPEHMEPVSEAENIRRGKSAKLTIENVREIRRLNGQVSQHELARRHGVHVSTINLIVKRKNWRDVE